MLRQLDRAGDAQLNLRERCILDFRLILASGRRPPSSPLVAAASVEDDDDIDALLRQSRTSPSVRAASLLAENLQDLLFRTADVNPESQIGICAAPCRGRVRGTPI